MVTQTPSLQTLARLASAASLRSPSLERVSDRETLELEDTSKPSFSSPVLPPGQEQGEGFAPFFTRCISTQMAFPRDSGLSLVICWRQLPEGHLSS